MKRILQILNYAAPYKGNFMASIEGLEEVCLKNNMAFTYLFPRTASNLPWVKEMMDNGKDIHFIDNSFFSKIIKVKNLISLHTLVKENKIDIIHTHFIEYNYTLFIFKHFLFHFQPIIAHFHCQFNPAKSLVGNFKRWISKITNSKIIGVSKAVADELIQQGFPQRKTGYIFNAIDFKRLDTFDSNLKITQYEEQKVLLMFGWLYFVKGVDIVVQAFIELKKKRSDLILAIALSGGRSNIENEIKKMFGEVPEGIMFLDARNDIATYYNASDIFISASREEGFSYALVEAAYCSSLIVSSDIAAPASLEIPEVAYFKSGDSNDLYNVLEKLLDTSDDMKKNIKTRQKDYVISKFVLDKWANEVIKLYED